MNISCWDIIHTESLWPGNHGGLAPVATDRGNNQTVTVETPWLRLIPGVRGLWQITHSFYHLAIFGGIARFTESGNQCWGKFIYRVGEYF